ncbi:phosphoserine phosphatase SerB [Acetobacter sp. AN02]|uniref:phosphoserine phosphatase SerB n=1 Tax=Acetobacter sp. AN02 TaxID=2894186 RepID=UPI0024345C8D|nr:phosphoserine phosphatase SerB [Acetobacter sp. AN02]MDG6094891.1 phosphoserine phosphatase SerB [Acetobacter sp. AN02]
MSFILTLVAPREATTLTDSQISAARDMVRGGQPVILSPGEAADIPCGEIKPAQHDAARAAFGRYGIDVLVTKSRGRRKAVLVADMDSTIVTSETLDEIAALAGIGEEVTAITRRSMNGELNFEQALRERVALLKGKSADLLEQVWTKTELTPGARELVATMRAHNATTALVSGGFTFFTSRVKTLCGFTEDHANTLLENNGILTGETGEPVLGPDAKLQHLTRIAEERGVKPAATLAIGDGANDLPMLRNAGLGLAFHGKPVVRREITNRIDHGTLRAALFAQGYPATAFRSG